MMIFCIPLSFLHSYLRIKANSVWAAAALHGMLNACVSLTILFVVGANPLVGGGAGLAGTIAGAITCALVFGVLDRGFAKEYF